MRMSQEALVALEADMDQEVDQRIKDYPVRIHLHGKTIEAENTKVDYSGGEVNIYLDGDIMWWSEIGILQFLDWRWTDGTK